MGKDASYDKVKAIDVAAGKSVNQLLTEMGETGFQGRRLAEVVDVMEAMARDDDVTILFGYAGSMSTTGQWRIVNWLIEQGLIDILVPTGANVSEDIVEAMGASYYKGHDPADDVRLFEAGFNRYYNVLGGEKDYMEMTELIAEFILSLDEDKSYSSREFLRLAGVWLKEKGIDCIVATAAEHDVPVFCPAIADSPYGDAALIARSKGFNLKIDAMKDYIEFMELAEKVTDTGVVYVGGGVPKDFIQLFAVTPDLLYEDRRVPNKDVYRSRAGVNEQYFPHKYAVQITTDSPQWGGLSGCSFDEAVSWGKETMEGRYIQCYCDATIALPLVSHALADRVKGKRNGKRLSNQVNQQ